MAKEFWFHKSTISREISRNTSAKYICCYSGNHTQQRADLHAEISYNPKSLSNKNIMAILGTKVISPILSLIGTSTNENACKLIRWYLPKRTYFNWITNKQIMYIESVLNNHPRKYLGLKHYLKSLTLLLHFLIKFNHYLLFSTIKFL